MDKFPWFLPRPPPPGIEISAKRSFLSSAIYGYDFVVATTQSSINGTLLQYLSSLDQKPTSVCYIADSKGFPAPISYEELKSKANGSDPFTVPDGADPATNQDLKNLFAARFMFGFRASLGVPPGYAPEKLPDVVVLGNDTSQVTYNMLCSEFTICEFRNSGWAPPIWVKSSQPLGDAWIFQSKVDLRMSPVGQNEFNKLPPLVQEQIKYLGEGSFGVQQLLFDLTNAGLMPTFPTIEGIDTTSETYSILQQAFLNNYFQQMRKVGQPLLHCAIVHNDHPATLVPTDLNMEVCALVDGNGRPFTNPTPEQQQLTTLNYLCSVYGNALPPPVPFNWNWVDSSESSQFDGIVSINRNTFVRYLKEQLLPLAKPNCLVPSVKVTTDGWTTTFQASVSKSPQSPSATTPPTGPLVLKLHWEQEAHDSAGLNDDMGELRLRPSYDAEVTLQGNTIVVTQRLAVYLYVRSLQTSTDGNIVHKFLRDTYTLGVDEWGAMVVERASDPLIDLSERPSVNGFLNLFTSVNDIVDSIRQMDDFMSTGFQDFPIGFVQNFVFPGGKTFAFKRMGFSDNQDLVACITYVDPTPSR